MECVKFAYFPGVTIAILTILKHLFWVPSSPHYHEMAGFVVFSVCLVKWVRKSPIWAMLGTSFTAQASLNVFRPIKNDVMVQCLTYFVSFLNSAAANFWRDPGSMKEDFQCVLGTKIAFYRSLYSIKLLFCACPGYVGSPSKMKKIQQRGDFFGLFSLLRAEALSKSVNSTIQKSAEICKALTHYVVFDQSKNI